MDKLKPYVIGVDLGGTNTVFGIVSARGEVIAQDSIKTKQHKTAAEFVEAGLACLRPLVTQVGGIEQIQGMGIGAPNGNYYNGTIEFAPNLPWAHDGVIPLAQLFSDALGIPVKLTNDDNAAAMGEMTYGAARGMKNFIVITLGTGVGSGIVINGQVVYGCDGFAGELGHVIMTAAPMPVPADAAARVAWRHTALPAVWPAQPARYCRPPTAHRCSARSHSMI